MSGHEMPTPEDMAKIHKERHISDSEHLKEGADGTFDDDGNLIKVNLSQEQIQDIKTEYEQGDTLEAYMTENTSVLYTADQIPGHLKEILQPKAGHFYEYIDGDATSVGFRYLDTDGNISTILINPEDVDFITTKDKKSAQEELETKLAKLGYKVTNKDLDYVCGKIEDEKRTEEKKDRSK